MARLKEIYWKEIAPKLKEELKLSNVMEVPRVTKITLNMGLGEAVGDKKSHRARCCRPGKDHRSESRCDLRSEIHRWL
jgi:ribosomal protein L5